MKSLPHLIFLSSLKKFTNTISYNLIYVVYEICHYNPLQSAIYLIADSDIEIRFDSRTTMADAYQSGQFHFLSIVLAILSIWRLW